MAKIIVCADCGKRSDLHLIASFAKVSEFHDSPSYAISTLLCDDCIKERNKKREDKGAGYVKKYARYDMALIEWEDITGRVREPLFDFSQKEIEDMRLIMQTVGFVHEYKDHYLVVSERDVKTGDQYGHNIYTLIPKTAVISYRRLFYHVDESAIPEGI